MLEWSAAFSTTDCGIAVTHFDGKPIHFVFRVAIISTLFSIIVDY